MATRRRSRATRLAALARQDTALEMTPMIDVTFLLLVFFMLTVRFQDLEGVLDAALPRDAGSAAPSEPRERTDVRIAVVRAGTRLDPRADRAWSGEGPFRFGPDRVLSYRVGPHETRDLRALETRLARLAKAHGEDAAVTLDPGAGTIYQDVVAVLDTAVSAGFRDVSFRGRRGPLRAR